MIEMEPSKRRCGKMEKGKKIRNGIDVLDTSIRWEWKRWNKKRK